MEVINEYLGIIVGKVWDLPMVIALVGIGIFLTVALGFIQIKGFKHAINVVRGKYDDPR